ncbi:MAG: 16S rRNA (cytidine(1402)-2'-O)-methyltransferase [Bifidobacteriaceae bacterium]|jgi:16S rRNA (cytidine1402-2'-O)-methyltransferase|nr:16S rRNA (cytidine(1402)-2'-O)-methyltransferase [Bifidobacteriaceae bacterium]
MPLIFAGLPIGNIDDLSVRVKEAISNADIIAAEDTRVFKNLLRRADLKTNAKIISFFDHNENQKTKLLLDSARDKNALIVSDAGMPAISDPGWTLMSAAIENDIEYAVLPGPSAFLQALIMSGFPIDKFSFLGFAPRRAGKLEQFYNEIANTSHTVAFYESPHRIEKSLQTASTILKNREIAVCREITKKYESTIRGNASSVLEAISHLSKLGELTVVVSSLQC